MNYKLIKSNETDKTGHHEHSEWFITDEYNYIAGLVPCHKGSEELAEDAVSIVRDLNELAALREQNAELIAALEAITERAEVVSEGITVDKRNPGVSQAKHVAHMASHLEQHAKKARAILAKVKGGDNA